MVSAGIGLEKLEDLLEIKIQTENSVTVSGFMAEKLQRLPQKGDRVFFEGFCFQVQQASSHRVLQVLIFPSNQDAEKPEA
jgi:CBS domain containing-hemolysin-like protein